MAFWVSNQLISQDDSHKLLDAIETNHFDWKRLAKYSFWIALICIGTAVISVITDRAIMKWLDHVFNAPAIIKSFFFFAVSTGFYFLGIFRKKNKPTKRYSNESIFFLGVLSTAAAIAFLGEAIDTGSGHFSILILLTAVIYLILGLWFPSKLVWLFALLSMGAWFGAETGYVSGWGAYYLGMNYPLRFILFGLVLILSSYLFKKTGWNKDFFKITRTTGLLYFLIALWILSIFGNYGDISSWYQVKQYELLHWSFVFGGAALMILFHGIKYEDHITRGFGLTFLFLNLYTRFFEYFWDSTHKAIFFALMGLSFWMFGRYAEKIWTLGSEPYIEKQG